MLRRAGAASGTGVDRRRWPVVMGVGLLVAASGREAAAAAVGSFGASTGLLATLLALLALKGWSAAASFETVSAAGGALLVAAVAAWLVPGRRIRWVGARPAPASRTCAPDPAAQRCRAALGARGIDPVALTDELDALFRRVHRAWDRDELQALRDSTTPSMLDELVHERALSPALAPAARTRIVTVDAELLDYDELAEAAVLTVAFSGALDEGDDRLRTPFRELWLLTRPLDASGCWKLARHQTLY